MAMTPEGDDPETTKTVWTGAEVASDLARSVPAVAAGLLGALVFAAIGLPAPWLAGAMAGTAIAGLAGANLPFAAVLRDAGFILGGAALGASLTPEMLDGISRYPASLSIMAVTMALVIGAVALVLRGLYRWDWVTAVLAAAPGALSSVMAVAIDGGARVDRVAFNQSIRLLFLVAILPTIAGSSTVAGLTPPVHADATAVVITLGVAVAGAVLIGRLRIAAAFFIGATLGSAALHVSGVLSGTLPVWLVNTAMLLIGAQAGLRFAGLSLSELVGQLPAAVVGLCVSILVAAAGAAAAAAVSGIPLGAALVAFAPGGLEAMVALALALSLDPLYVSVHHVVRFFGLGLVLPFLVRPLVAAARAKGNTSA